MSKHYVEEKEYDRFSNPKLPSTNTIMHYDSNNLRSVMESNENVNLYSVPHFSDFPSKASHSRSPIKIMCRTCNELTMTDIEHENGTASKIWCFLLMPFFCTGCCCLCLNSCKDVKHVCSKCRNDAGLCASQVC